MKKSLFFIVTVFALKYGHAQQATIDEGTNQKAKNESPFFSKLYVKLYTGYGFFSPGSYRVQSTNIISYHDQNNNYKDTVIQSQGNKGIG